MPSSARRWWAAPPALARASAPACSLLSAITTSPLRRTTTGPLEGHDLLAADVARRHVVEQDGTAAAQRDVEDAAGHDAVGRVGSADLADRAEVEAAGMAAHRLGDQPHARPGQPHQVPVQRVDGAPGVAAGGGERLVPRRAIVRAQRLRRARERGVEVGRSSPPGPRAASRPCLR